MFSVSLYYLLVFITQSASEKSQSYTEIKLLRKVTKLFIFLIYILITIVLVFSKWVL